MCLSPSKGCLLYGIFCFISVRVIYERGYPPFHSWRFCSPSFVAFFSVPLSNFIIELTHSGEISIHFFKSHFFCEIPFLETRRDLNLFFRYLQFYEFNGGIYFDYKTPPATDYKSDAFERLRRRLSAANVYEKFLH